MALTFPSGFYLAKLRWRLDGDAEEMISTIALRNNEPGERDLNEVAHAVHAAWAGAWESNTLGTGFSFVGVDVTEGSENEATTQGTWNQVIAGVGNWASLPNNCAMLIKKRTAVAGRQNSGRMFLPSGYLPEANVSNTGAIINSYNDYQNCATQFYDNLRDQNQPIGGQITSFWPVVLHGPRRNPQSEQPLGGPITYTPGGAPTDVTSLVVDARIATQRERMR